ncbi:hypothetical protein BD779DRAFT_1676913 [Infundibulicybe gibba]|nr:hypothetical protein BD779DRAFT_1676913 [Infundibulicybe gibba]
MSRLDALNRHKKKHHPQLQNYSKTSKPPTRRRKVPTTDHRSKNMISMMVSLHSSQSTTDSTMHQIDTNRPQFPSDTLVPSRVPIYLTEGVLLVEPPSVVSTVFSGGHYPQTNVPTHQPLSPGALRFPINFHNDQAVTSPPPEDAMTHWEWSDLLGDVGYTQSSSTQTRSAPP